MEVSGQIHDPAALPSGKELRHFLDRRMGGLQSRSRRYEEQENISLAGNQTPAVQPVARGCTVWGIQAHQICYMLILKRVFKKQVEKLWTGLSYTE
jgi:hypothetical protein